MAVADQGLLAKQRRALILEAVRRDGAVRVSDLVASLGVSDMTVRRDLDALERRGMLEKVHGGAVATVGSGEEPGFDVKSGLESAAKASIADAAAALVKPGSVVGLGAGTTTHAVAKRLLNIPDLTLVTNSLPIEQLFRNSVPNAQAPTVLLTGGAATRSEALVGPIADRTIESLHMDVLILGTHGVSEREGLTSPNLAEAQTNRVFISRTRQVVVAADHTKWGTVGLSTFAELGQIGFFVTDAGLSVEARSVLGERVGQLIVVGVGEEQRGNGR
ncbi:DeoR/GlpR family DNA-binding transcription regulator [Streptomyces sp. NRRL B-24484]|uniref:DeoR/GlpR family DNA-binding transcription regulator n=1 Tax=Streptomyces sp. NRRL B-24484 TaxID=1463833 RepID=UPI002D21921E|nr:DeoR/GlpR family DNA-binding transcription regulator [Streptomyces sp. NRRL B-24484]